MVIDKDVNLLFDRYIMNYSYTTVDYTASPAVAAVGMVVLAIELILLVLFIITYWKIFVKAGKPGWAVLIPIYNLYILIKIVKRPGWWLLLFLIPLVNIVIALIIALDLAKVFGKDAVFGIFLNFLLQPIGPIFLAFGSAKYQK